MITKPNLTIADGDAIVGDVLHCQTFFPKIDS